MKKLFSAYQFHILGFIFIAVLGTLFFLIFQKQTKSQPLPKITHVFAKDLFTTPTASPSPKLSPTPTPTPIPAGFCLHVPVLFYHHVQPISIATTKGQSSLSVDNGLFDKQMAYLAGSGYTTISGQQLVNALLAHSQLPGKSVVITFDDGYEDVFTYAYPILQKYHMVGNVMIPTGLLGGRGPNDYFSWDELKQMVGSGLVFAYDHTWSHYSTGSGTKEKDQFEIMTGKQQLEANLGKPVNIFVYPYGSGQTNPRVISLLQSDGFIGAFSTIGGSLQCDSYIFTLRRIRIGNAPLASYGL